MLAEPAIGADYRVDGVNHVIGYPGGKGVHVALPQQGAYTLTLRSSDFQFGHAGPASPHVVGFCDAYVDPGDEVFTLNGEGAHRTLNAQRATALYLFFVDYQGSIDDNSGSSTVEVTGENGSVLGSYQVNSVSNAIGFIDTHAVHVPISAPGTFIVTLESSSFKLGLAGPVSPMVLAFCPASNEPGDEVFSLNGTGTFKTLTTSYAAEIFLFFIDHDGHTADNSGSSVVSIERLGELSIQIASVELSWATQPHKMYQLQYKDELSGPDWINLKSPVEGTGTRVQVIDNVLGQPRRYYQVVSTPPGMVYVPAGDFEMGDTFAEGGDEERPLHTVYVSAFHMDKHEVTKALWDDVYQWAILNGYEFSSPGQGKAAGHPVHSITWYDAVKWCNARSEKEGRIPAYYADAAQVTVYRTGQIDLQDEWVKWNVGYRLPTEAEWQKAARGGLAGTRFPWGDTISHSQANYQSTGAYAYDVSPTRGYHPSYAVGDFPYTSPVGSFLPNGYGLHDVAGNVWEWCWDWYSDAYYITSPGSNPHGPPTGSRRMYWGGGWLYGAHELRLSRRYHDCPGCTGNNTGLRCVVPAVQP